jgi:hypothetical protein
MKLDLRKAYHRFQNKNGDESNTAFRMRYGQFEYGVKLAGLKNAPAIFQALSTTAYRLTLTIS